MDEILSKKGNVLPSINGLLVEVQYHYLDMVVRFFDRQYNDRRSTTE